MHRNYRQNPAGFHRIGPAHDLPKRRTPEPYRNPIDAGIHKRKRPDDREREFFGYGRKGASQYL